MGRNDNATRGVDKGKNMPVNDKVFDQSSDDDDEKDEEGDDDIFVKKKPEPAKAKGKKETK